MGSGLQPGHAVGPWRLEGLLGQGAQGSAWTARHVNDGRRQILKQLRGSGAGPARVRFDREAEILRHLRHPHLVPALELLEHPDGPFIRMAQAPGIDLRRVLFERAQRDRGFALADVERFVGMVCDALAYCHAERVIHRDLKPGNVMVVFEGDELRHLTLLDFGVARLTGRNGSLATTAGRVLGSHRYASPEQLRGEPVGPESDLFALAAMVWEMLTLRRAWLRRPDGQACRWHESEAPGPNGRVEVVRRIIDGSWIRLSTLDPGLVEFDRFFERAFAPVGFDRFYDAASFADAFGDAARAAAVLPESGPTGGWTFVDPRPFEAADRDTLASTAGEEAETRIERAPPSSPVIPESRARPTVPAAARAESLRRARGPSRAQRKQVFGRAAHPTPTWVRALAWLNSPWVTLAILAAASILLAVLSLEPSPPPPTDAPAPRARPR